MSELLIPSYRVVAKAIQSDIVLDAIQSLFKPSKSTWRFKEDYEPSKKYGKHPSIIKTSMICNHTIHEMMFNLGLATR